MTKFEIAKILATREAKLYQLQEGARASEAVARTPELREMFHAAARDYGISATEVQMLRDELGIPAHIWNRARGQADAERCQALRA